MSATTEKTEVMELAVIVKGEIVKSNFDDFAKVIDDQLAEINTDLVSDADFGQAEQDVKGLKVVERAITDARADVLAQMEGPNTLLIALDGKGEDVRAYRLGMEKDIKAKKIEVKKSIVTEALDLISHDAPAKYQSQIEDAMKGKRNFDSLREAADGCANSISDRLTKNHEVIGDFVKDNGSGIAPDVSRLEDMELDALREQLTRRAELAKQEAENKRLDEERKKAEAELAEMKRKEVDEKARMDAKAEAGAKALEEEHGKTALVDTEQTLDLGPRNGGILPVGNTPAQTEPSAGITAEQEMLEFANTVIGAFGLIKEPRKKLVHPENISKAGVFAEAALKNYNLMMGDSK